MQEADKKLLVDAIARNSGAVLSLPSAGMLRHHKSRFLAEAGESFWIESAPGESALIEELIASRQPCGVSFKAGQIKVVFACPVDARQTQYRINETTTVEALLMRFPESVKAIQRRNAYRVYVPGECDIRVKVWRMSPRSRLQDRPLAAQAIVAQVRDLSIGGMGVTFYGNDNQPPVINSEDRLRIEIAYGEHNLLVEGRMRHPTAKITTASVRAGVQFKALGADLDGRQTLSLLTRIVGELQRAEVRRVRLGMTGAA